MKILAVGSAGYVGSNIVDLLLSAGHEVVVYDILLYTNSYLKDVPFIYGDVRDKEKLLKILPDFDCVVWLAALVGEAASKVNEELTRDINFESVKWLVENYKGKIVFFSTASVYGRNSEFLKEDAEVNPLSLYAETKYQAERIVMEKAPGALVFRLGTLGGYGAPGRSGGVGYGRFRTDLVLNVWSIQAAQGLPLKVMGKNQWRPLLNVASVASAVEFGLRNNISGLYNLVDENLQLGELAERIAKVSANKCEIIYSDLAFDDLRDYKIDGSAYQSLGWKPEYGLDEAVSSIVKLVQEKRISDLTDPIYSNGAYMNKIQSF